MRKRVTSVEMAYRAKANTPGPSVTSSGFAAHGRRTPSAQCRPDRANPIQQSRRPGYLGRQDHSRYCRLQRSAHRSTSPGGNRETASRQPRSRAARPRASLRSQMRISVRGSAPDICGLCCSSMINTSFSPTVSTLHCCDQCCHLKLYGGYLSSWPEERRFLLQLSRADAAIEVSRDL